MNFQSRGFELTEWQREAVEAWTYGVDGAPFRGTIEVVTGGGKSLIALTCIAEAARVAPGLKVAIVVPTQALAQQWRAVLATRTNLDPASIGLLGAGGKSTLEGKQVLVAVLNTAAEQLPSLAAEHQPLMLVVDECHRAGAPKFSNVLTTPSEFRLGLSATPDREEVNDDGEPLAYDEQVVGRQLGGVVFSFGLKQARNAGWLPDYTLHHHAVMLLPDERERYARLSREVDDAADELRALGGDQVRARQLGRRADDLGRAAARWVMLTAQRKDLLYRAAERQRVASLIVKQLFATGQRRARAILFHERVAEAIELHNVLRAALPNISIALEHSKLPERERQAALASFASGDAPVLVSVKSLIEGIDVPAADTGLSVASTSSVRQRVQALGRVLRRAAEGGTKQSEMHLIYVGDTVDDLIYAKTDWSDLTGESLNRYWRWQPGSESPEALTGPPRTPKPTEDQAWTQLQESQTPLPAPWPGEFAGQEYSVSSAGVVHNSFKRLISNPQGIADMVSSLRRERGERGGRFRITPEHRLVLVWKPGEGEGEPWIVGQLDEAFVIADEVAERVDLSLLDLVPGAEYHGPTDKTGGIFRLTQKGGGQVERAVPGGREFALADGPTPGAENARAVLAAWDRAGRPTARFFVNKQGHAWYEAEGERRFLADVAGGFEWPGPNLPLETP